MNYTKKVWLVPTIDGKFCLYDNINVNNSDCIKVVRGVTPLKLSECLQKCQDNNWYMLSIDVVTN